MALNFDWTITFGTLLETVSLVGGGVVFLSKVKGDIRDLYTRLGHFGKDIEGVKQENYRQSEKLDRLIERTPLRRIP